MEEDWMHLWLVTDARESALVAISLLESVAQRSAFAGFQSEVGKPGKEVEPEGSLRDWKEIGHTCRAGC